MAKFPTYQQHYYATAYSQKHTGGAGTEENGYEPDNDNVGGGNNFRRKLISQTSFSPKMKNSYLNYLSRAQKAARIIKF